MYINTYYNFINESISNSKYLLLDIDNTLCSNFSYKIEDLTDKYVKEYYISKHNQVVLIRPFLKEFFEYIFKEYTNIGFFSTRPEEGIIDFIDGILSLNIITERQYKHLTKYIFDDRYVVPPNKDLNLVADKLNCKINDIILFDDQIDFQDTQQEYKIEAEYFSGKSKDTYLLKVIQNKIL